VDVLWGLMKSPDLNFVISQRVKYNLILLIILGVATSLLDVTLLRFAHYFVHGSETGREIYSARKAYTLISETLPEDVIVQYNPSIVVNRPVGLYGMRQSAISDRTAYGVSMDRYNAKVLAVSEIFNMENLQNWQTLDALCDKHSINVIVVIKSDPLWKSLGLLEKQRASLYADNYNAVFFCGAKTSSQKNP
jgi:hypothetical protein